MSNEEKLRNALAIAKVQLGLLKSIIVCKEQFTDADEKTHSIIMKHIQKTLEETKEKE